MKIFGGIIDMEKETKGFSVGKFCMATMIIAGIVVFLGLMVYIVVSGVMTDRRYEARKCSCEICSEYNTIDEYKGDVE